MLNKILMFIEQDFDKVYIPFLDSFTVLNN